MKMSKDNATHFCARSGDSYCWDEFLGYGVWYEKLGEWVRSMFTQDEIKPYLTKLSSNEMKSDRLADEIMTKGKEAVYTQEMFNKSEIPKVGMQVGVRFNKASQPNYGKLIALTGQYIILLEGEAQEQHYTRGTWIFVPVDQRTESEKAVDDLVLQINRVQYDANMSDMDLKDIIAVAFEAGISFTGDKK
jgi:hypothetical protein